MRFWCKRSESDPVKAVSAVGTFYDVAMRRLDAQMQTIDSVDAKATTAYAASGGILAFYGVLLTLASTPTDTGLKVLFLTFLSFAGIIFLGLMYSLYQTYQVRNWSVRPDMSVMQVNVNNADNDSVQYWVATECMASLEHNESLLDRKTVHLSRALVGITLEIVCLCGVGATIIGGK